MGSDKVLVLCEDQRQESIIRPWLRSLGFNVKREVRFVAHVEAALGKKRNNAWVLQNYATFVRQIRSRLRRMQCALVVCLDADEQAIDVWLKYFDERLQGDSAAIREKHEPLVILTPQRNVETWMFYLSCGEVNDKDDYKMKCANAKVDYKAQAERFARIACRQEALPEDAPSSLAYAVTDECPRISHA